jgi:hypothetical protein
MWGHPKEIVQRLQTIASSPEPPAEGEIAKAFPLICLFTDIPVTMNTPIGFNGTARLQIIIANATEQNLLAPERLEKNFKPVLRPIKKEFLRQVGLYSTFSFPELPRHTEIERYYWGRQGLYGNEGNILNDYVDCIEIENLEVRIKNDTCFTSKKNF